MLSLDYASAMKVVINKCYGGFSLSPYAEIWLYQNGCKSLDVTPIDEYYTGSSLYFTKEKALTEWHTFLQTGKYSGLFVTTLSADEKFVINGRDVERHDPLLIQVVEEMGEKAEGPCANLRIIEIPDGTDYEVQEYDGMEWIAEKHQTWR